MTDISIQLSATSDWGSKLIRYRSASKYSHVDIVIPFGVPHDMGYYLLPSGLLGARSNEILDKEANVYIPAGVEIRPEGYEDWTICDRLTLSVSVEVARDFYANAFAQLHKKYDSTAIWGFAVGRDWRAADSWFCSELVIWDSEKSHAIPDLHCEPNKIFPGEAAIAWSAAGARLGA